MKYSMSVDMIQNLEELISLALYTVLGNRKGTMAGFIPPRMKADMVKFCH